MPHLLPLFVALQSATTPALPQAHLATHVVSASCFAADGQSLVFPGKAAGKWDLYAMRLDRSGLGGSPRGCSPGTGLLTPCATAPAAQRSPLPEWLRAGCGSSPTPSTGG
jgi:hypothetical protein